MVCALTACGTHGDAPIRHLDSGEQIRVIHAGQLSDGDWYVAKNNNRRAPDGTWTRQR
jgi:hypothetical protein